MSSKILMVDDNLQNIQVLGNLLENEGYQTEFALSGKEALNWIEESVFDLILLDVMMPGMNGFEVCVEIRKNSDYQDVPVIFVTAKTDTYSTLKGFDVKAQDYISKPFEQNELLARIKTQIELKQSKDLLKNMNSVLEEKVRERTKDLIQAHQKLEATNRELEIANQELRQLDEAKNKFLHLISHEMRTPLNGLVGSTEILKYLVEDIDLLVSVGVLEESVKRLQRFSLDAILLTSLSMHSYHIVYEQVNIKELLGVVITKHKKAYPAKKH
ncbi:MAG: response regulator [Marinilabiliaceae bacterium]|nr:response regulator [Marinilabiliaceae bacterium]